MTYRFVDRLSGNACEVQAGGTLLGRFILEPSGDEAMFLNSVAISESAYCVPDLRGQWQLLQPGQERIEGTISRTQVLDRLDTSSILDVGTSVEDVKGRTLAEIGQDMADFLAFIGGGGGGW